MGLLTKVLTFPISVPAAGLKGLILKLHETAEGQYYNAEAVRGQLVALSDQLDSGDISLEDFETLEEQLLDRLDEIAAYERAKVEGRQ